MLVTLAHLALCFPYLTLSVCARDDIAVRRAAASSASSSSSSSAIAAPTAISISPSQNWDGPDGPWSSFTLRVGTPEQIVRVLISTASQQTWVVLAKGCLPSDTPCKDARGGIYYPENSTTWSQQGDGYYQLQLELNLRNVSANGLYGNDTIGLGLRGSGEPTLENQIIGGIGAEQYYLGLFGVNPKPTSFTALDVGQVSYMTSLKDQNLIPSVSFAYSAGAPYRLKKVFASLTLGGYDISRFTPNDISFSFAPDNGRDLVVGIQSINSSDQDGTTHNLLSSGILAYVDSTVPQIWLPIEACEAFEKAFGLTYDEISKLYPVNDALHKKLLAQNATISFTLGSTKIGGKTINIVLPYNSFDLQASPPFTQNSTKYFPLQRAANDTQYTLGRAFLQEAYLIVDWERSNFSISQCLFNDGAQPQIVAIEAASSTVGETQPKKSPSPSSSNDKKIGIAVGITIVLVVIIASGVAILFYKKRKTRRAGGKKVNPDKTLIAGIQQRYPEAELNTDHNHAVYEIGGPRNLERHPQTMAQTHEPSWAEERARHLGDRTHTGELNGDHSVLGLSQSEPLLGPHEMYGSSSMPIELAERSPSELHGSNPISQHPNSGRSSLDFRSVNRSPVLPSVGRSQLSFHTSPAPTSPTIRLWDRRPRSQSSNHGDKPRSSSPISQSLGTSAETPHAPRENEVFSPISPMTGESSTSQQAGLFSFLRGIPHARRSSGRPASDS